jgi:hypothetical protein
MLGFGHILRPEAKAAMEYQQDKKCRQVGGGQQEGEAVDAGR